VIDVGVLDGKIAIVTGASRGIGAAIAERFGAEGAAVAVAARTTEPGQSRFPGTIAGTAASIREAGGTAVSISADLSWQEDRQRLVDETARELGPVDILVNNAAVTYFTPVADFSPKRYALMFAVQVEAPFELAKLVLPGMRERGRGWILNISSNAARHPSLPPRFAIGSTVYGMCKAALERFSTGLAAELYEDNIAVNALSPTRVVPTPGTIFHHLTTEDDPNAEPPAVMAEAALMLCHTDPKTLTGRVTYSQELLTELGVAIPASK
jgi:NAD(P)-dependent dehydrogenase (short-subunit alcohol dehydrogenase family)